MTHKILILAACLATIPLAAQADGGPQSLGNFGNWTAATYGSGAGKACYAFTKPESSAPALPKRGPVLLTVTERAGSRDEVSIDAGFTYAKAANVVLTVGSNKLGFYTSGSDAFALDGGKTVLAFQGGASAVAKSPAPGGQSVTDNFSLAGFSDAYKAIVAACPK